MAEVQQADRRLVVADAERLAAGWIVEDAERAPVAREPARVRGDKDDVRGHAACEQILAILRGVARQAGGDNDESGGAVELAGRAGLGVLLELLKPLARVRPDNPEPPRVGQMVVGGPARQLEQLVERL